MDSERLKIALGYREGISLFKITAISILRFLVIYLTIILGKRPGYHLLSHAIENTANQKARNPLHILRYPTVSIPRKNPGVPRGLQKAFVHLMSSTYLYFLIFNQNYVLLRNVANLLNVFSLIVFAVKALKSDVLC